MRTEEQVLKDFDVQLNYVVDYSYNHKIVLRKYNTLDTIQIYKETKTYEKQNVGYQPIPITLEEHKLLNELFQIWGWL